MANFSVVVVLFMFGLCLSPCLTMMTGGISRTQETKPIMEGVGMYLENINAHHSFDYKVKCDKLEASSQVVQGFLYRVALELVPVEKGAIDSDCIRGSGNFRLEKEDVKFVCLQIWSRSWLPGQQKLILEEVDEHDVESCLAINDK